MDVATSGTGPRPPDEWKRIIKAEALATVKAEEIFVACRSLDRDLDGQLVGELMAGLAERAARFLRTRVGRNHPNGGADIIHATIGKLQDAILDPSHTDAVGYSTGFFAKLDLRLMDQLRRSKTRSSREQEVKLDEDGNEPDMPDLSQATPEQAMAIAELLHDVDPRKRSALALIMAGYPAYTDHPGGNSVASMLNVSRKTAETWIRDVKKLVLARIGG